MQACIPQICDWEDYFGLIKQTGKSTWILKLNKLLIHETSGRVLFLASESNLQLKY